MTTMALRAPYSPNVLFHLVRLRSTKSLPGGFLFIASLAVFLILDAPAESLERGLVIVAALAFHELGHAIAMLAFGYRDVRVFFLPGFGALTTGSPLSVSTWRRAAVLLAGPLPGIIAGGLLVVTGSTQASPTLDYAARVLVLFNIFNLLPFTPLDGGGLLDLAFARSRALALLTRGTSLAFFALAALFTFNSAFLLLVVAQARGIFDFLAVSSAADRAFKGGTLIPERMEASTLESVRAANDALNWRLGKGSNRARARWIRLVIQRAIDLQHAPRPIGSAVVLFAWCASFMLGLFALAVLAKSS